MTVTMTGADSAVQTLKDGGVELCLANPGTSEMHLVAALDRAPGLRSVLVLFEGVAAGAADGYARMSGRPAATLLHLGPGLANALSALHNARKAPSPIINIIGDHATFHLRHNAPLTSDIEGIARPVSHWLKTTPSSAAVATDVARAITEARHAPGHIASLILPADCAWGPATGAVTAAPARGRAVPPARQIEEAAAALRGGGPNLLLLGGAALYRRPLALAGRIVAASGADVRTEIFNSRMERGAGLLSPPRIPYPVDEALAVLAPYRNIVLAGATEPVAFFAYPDRPGVLRPEGCRVVALATPEQDCTQALAMLADALDAAPPPRIKRACALPPVEDGALAPHNIGACLAQVMPEGVIVVDESQTTGFDFLERTRFAPPHDWLRNRGGSIGSGPPLATGAALACPERPVLCLQSDGSGMYSLQALWTQAREGLAVTTVVFANREYYMLRGELQKAGVAEPGPCALNMLQIDRPVIDWVSLARGMGVEACRVEDTGGLCRALRGGIESGGPYLIEAVL